MELDKYRKYQNPHDLAWSAIQINNLRAIKKNKANLKSKSTDIDYPFYYRFKHFSLKFFINHIGARKLYRRTRENISIRYSKYRKRKIFITRNKYERIRSQ